MGKVVIKPYILVSKLKKAKTGFLRCTRLSKLYKTPYKARFKSEKMHRHLFGILLGTNCAPLVDNLFQFCYERFL